MGKNSNLPSVLTAKPPALNPSESEMIRTKLNAIHSARQNFLKAEASQKIKNALKHSVRTYSEQQYTPGQKVYYKRPDTKGWKGPARVLGQDGNFVLIREGKTAI